jgi:type IV pilus assembly protein PilB
MIAASVNGVIAQRLVRKICPDCRETYDPEPELLSRLGLSNQAGQFSFYRGMGCSTCGNSGYKGRTVIEEVMVVDRELRELILSEASTDRLRDSAMERGMILMGASGMAKVKQGITTIDEVLKAVSQENMVPVSCPHCGKEAPSGTDTCPFCNGLLRSICRDCGRAIQPDWKICPYCGKILAEASPSMRVSSA